MPTLLLAEVPETSAISVRRYHARERAQVHLTARRIDRALAGGISPDSSVTISLRAHTLIGIRARRKFANGLRILLIDARAPAWPPAPVPLCRRKIIAAEPLIDKLADRLVIENRPVAARGVAQIRLLLTDGRSPVYCDPQAHDLQPALRAAALALEPAYPIIGHEPRPHGSG